jgi:hypothetical protein
MWRSSMFMNSPGAPPTSAEHFCTYFDHRYAAKALAMWKSLKKHNGSATLHALCLSGASREIFARLQLPDVHLIPLQALEDVNPELQKARSNRSLLEYYFTLTPCLPLFIFRTHPDVSRLTYLDADLFFFADPRPVLDEVGDDAVGLIEHRFPDKLANLEIYGRFNVGWMTFRMDAVTLECLETWRKQCLEWCYDRAESGRYAEQKYLDDWPDRFPRVHVIQHRGANVAPWNIDSCDISFQDDVVSVGGQPLVFFHAHGFVPGSPGRPRVLNLDTYDVEETPLLARVVFDQYESAVLAATTEIATPLALALLAEEPRDVSRMLETLRSVVTGLESRLESSEADRGARLQAMHTLRRQLDATASERDAAIGVIDSLRAQLAESEADRAARLALIHSLQAQWHETEADRAASRELISGLQAQLDASEADRAARLALIHSLQAQLHESEADRAASTELNSSLRAQLEQSNLNLAGLRLRLAHIRSRLDALERSLSWRWTRPLRWVAGLTSRNAARLRQSWRE